MNEKYPYQSIVLESIAKRLECVSEDKVQTQQFKITSKWFHSPLGFDLMLWKNEKLNLVKIQLGFMGEVVEWNPLDGLRTGIHIEQEWKASPQRINDILHYDMTLSLPALQRGLELLAHTHCIPPIDKAFINEILRAPLLQQAV